MQLGRHTSDTTPQLTTLGLNPVIDVPNYMDHYSFTDLWGMDGWVGHVGWPIADGLTPKRSPIQLAVWRRIGKVRRPILAFYPLCYAMWHFRGSKHTLIPPTYFQGAQGPNPCRIYARREAKDGKVVTQTFTVAPISYFRLSLSACSARFIGDSWAVCITFVGLFGLYVASECSCGLRGWTLQRFIS